MSEVLLSKKDSTPVSKKQKRNEPVSVPYVEEDYEPGMGPLPPGAEDGFDPNVYLNGISGKVEYKSDRQRTAVKLQATGLSESGMLRVYTDGSSLSNGAAGARAGVGVFFGPSDDRYAASKGGNECSCQLLTEGPAETFPSPYQARARPTSAPSLQRCYEPSKSHRGIGTLPSSPIASILSTA